MNDRSRRMLVALTLVGVGCGCGGGGADADVGEGVGEGEGVGVGAEVGEGADAGADAVDSAEPVDTSMPWSPVEIPGARVYQASSGITLDAPVAPLWSWRQTAATSPWHPRDGAGLAWFRDRLWLLGGWYGAAVAEWNDEVTTNEVWSSDDLGATWKLELAHDPSPPETGPDARWLPRHTAGWLTLTIGGVPYIYVVGGDYQHVTADVWRSADGLHWEQLTAAAPWAGRVLQMVGALGEDLYLMGGQIDLADAATALSDVWRSRDGGTSWERLPDAPWAPRGMTYNLVEHDAKVWLIGGGTYLHVGQRDFFNDVWSFDGSTWTQVLADGAAPWLGRQYHSTFAYAGELWVASGYGSDGVNHNDLWHSADGVTWHEVPGVAYLPGHADAFTITPAGVVHASGNAMDTAVHLMARSVEGAGIVRWSDLAARGPDLLPTEGTPMYMSHAFGDADGVWLDGTHGYLSGPFDGQPDGRSVFWVGRSDRNSAPEDGVNAAMTVVGDSRGACRHQAGYAADQIELVVTDASGAWAGGHVRRGADQNDGRARLVGFTHAVDGTVTGYIDGDQSGEPELHEYDRGYVGWDSIGAGYAGGNRAQVVLGLVVIIPDVISAGDLARLVEYARAWGVGD